MVDPRCQAASDASDTSSIHLLLAFFFFLFFVFTKMVLGLRYLHKEKHIVHRDLTPNNVMLGGKDKVTISKYQKFTVTVDERHRSLDFQNLK